MVRAHPGAPVVADALAAGTIADRLEMAGIEVLRTGAAQMGRACADLVDQVNTGSIAHRAQAALDECLAIAGRRALGDGWAWSRSGLGRRHQPAGGGDPGRLVGPHSAGAAAPFVSVAERKLPAGNFHCGAP